MCPAVVVTTSKGSNCVVTFILECPVYVHLKPPSLPSDVLSTTTMSLLLFVVIQHTYQYDSNKHRLFTLPFRITTNNNKDIVVVDSTSLGREGGLRWTYTGHSKINVTTQFDPFDVCQVSKYMYIMQPYLTKKIYFVYFCSQLFTTCNTTHP
jgi:hypothetical protein